MDGYSTRLLVGHQAPHLGPVDDCTEATTIVAWSQSLHSMVLIANTCKQWGCRFCGAMKVRQLATRCVAAKPNRLITLTVNPALHTSPREAFDSTRRQLPKFSQHFRRQLGEFEYMKVLEVTKKGWPHYHLVTRCPYVNQTDLSAKWDALTGARIVDVRAIKQTRDVYWYVTKYLAKQAYIEWTNRRVTMTKHFAQPQPKKDIGSLELIDAKRFYSAPRHWLRWEQPGTVWEQIGPLVWACVGGHRVDPHGGQAISLDTTDESEDF